MKKRTSLLIATVIIILAAVFVFLALNESDSVTLPVATDRNGTPSVETTGNNSVKPVPSGASTQAAVEKGLPVAIADMRYFTTGDVISFYVPQETATYQGEVQEVIVSDAGSKSLVGMFDIAGSEYRFVFTLGNEYTFGTLHTPSGRYQLESVAGQGRLVATSEINKDRDYSIPDYYVPEKKVIDQTKGS